MHLQLVSVGIKKVEGCVMAVVLLPRDHAGIPQTQNHWIEHFEREGER